MNQVCITVIESCTSINTYVALVEAICWNCKWFPILYVLCCLPVMCLQYSTAHNLGVAGSPGKVVKTVHFNEKVLPSKNLASELASSVAQLSYTVVPV